ncbi:MAG: Fe-S cluster assembly protein SufD [SAR202 cluster bacterium]|nr:Fe-S cluster assembly protein SufD [SAR202 cluster bacterium]
MSSFVNWIEKCFPAGDVPGNLSGTLDNFSGEEWKNTNLSVLFETNFILPGANLKISKPVLYFDDFLNLVFVNGIYSESLSNTIVNKDVLIGGFSKNKDKDHRIASYLDQTDVTNDPFKELNNAINKDMAVISLSENQIIDKPIHIMFITTEFDQPVMTCPKILLKLEPGSSCTVVESYFGESQGKYLTNSSTTIEVNDSAKINYYRLLLQGADSFHLGTVDVDLKANASLESTFFSKGSKLSRTELNVLMNGSYSECSINGLYHTVDEQHIDNVINIDHLVPNTKSNLIYKGILEDNSRASYSGKIFVAQDAQKTYALQSDKNLILSDKARVNTKPILEIFADDVECFHGATAGAIAEDAIFYLMSRGIDKKSATEMLIEAFASETIDGINPDAIRQYLYSILLNSKFVLV